MTAPSMAEVLAKHQRITSKPGGPCWCGEWPRDEGPRQTWMAHVAQALAAAGFGHVASVEAERRSAQNHADDVLRDCRAAEARADEWAIRLRVAEARLAAVRALADDLDSGSLGGLVGRLLNPTLREVAADLRRALDGEGGR